MKLINIIFLFFVLIINIFADPLENYDSTRRINWYDGATYQRDEYQWWIKNTEQPSNLYYGSTTPTSQETGTNDLNILGVWEIQSHASNIIVAVIDRGCDDSFSDLFGVVIGGKTFAGTNILNYYNDIGGGHGTRIATLIAAKKDDKEMVGIAPGCKLWIAATGYGINEISLAITNAVDFGVNIISLSWSTSVNSEILSNACYYAYLSNIIICAASPNQNVNMDFYQDFPGAWCKVLSNIWPVASTDRTGNKYSPSGYGTNTIAAPGRLILSKGLNGINSYSSGTSYATPIIAGCLALLEQKYPNQSIKAYRDAVFNTAIPVIGDTKRINILGAFQYPGSILSIFPGVLKINAPENWRYIIERTTDFRSWSNYSTNYGGESVNIGEGFYRSKVYR